MRMQKRLRHAVVHMAGIRCKYVFIKRAHRVVFAVTIATRSANRIAIIFEKNSVHSSRDAYSVTSNEVFDLHKTWIVHNLQ